MAPQRGAGRGGDMTQITMMIEGPDSRQVSEQINSMLLAVVAQNDVTLRKFEMDELSAELRNDEGITVPEFMREKRRRII